MGMIGRVILWLNMVVVPTAFAYMFNVYVAMLVFSVSVVNALYFDLRVRPRMEKVIRFIERLAGVK